MPRKPGSRVALPWKSTARKRSMPTRPEPEPETDALKLRHAAVANWCDTAGGLEEGTPELDPPRAAAGSARTGGLLPGIPPDLAWTRRGPAEPARSLAADRPRTRPRSLLAERHGDRVRADRPGYRRRRTHRGLRRLRRRWSHRLCHAGTRPARRRRRRHHLYSQPLHRGLWPEPRRPQ